MTGINFELVTDPNFFGGQVVQIKKGNRVLAVIYPHENGIEIKKSHIEEVKVNNLVKGVKVAALLTGTQRNVGSVLSSANSVELESKTADSVKVIGSASSLTVKFE